MRAVHNTIRDGSRHSMIYDLVFFIALLATALALGGALAHALELPNKIGLPRDEYFIVQKAYRGWNQLAYLLAIQLISMITLAVMSRAQPYVLWLTIVAIAFLLSAQAIFWVYTYPTNVATENWTAIPDNWELLRRQWEYSHAAGAAFQILAMSSLIIAALVRARSAV
jgi:hypothetical protein